MQPPYLGGLCKEHHAEDIEKTRRRDDAIRLLHQSTLDDQRVQTPELRDELYRLQKWWDRACSAVNFQRTDPFLQDEAPYAVEWCISLAQDIAAAERSSRNGGPATTPQLEITRHWVWERFTHLEQGLMSNGIKRP